MSISTATGSGSSRSGHLGSRDGRRGVPTGTGSASAHTTPAPAGNGAARTVALSAQLDELNNSGASGTAAAVVRNQRIRHIDVHAEGLTPDAPHAQHIHYGQQALNECPRLAQDDNHDGRVNTVEGIPAYGPVVVWLNTTGGATPASFLDVTRFPVSENGSYDYSRDNIKFTRVAGTGYSGGGGTPSRSPARCARVRMSSSSTEWTTTATACTTSASVPASSTRACPPKRPTQPPVACSRTPSDPYPLQKPEAPSAMAHRHHGGPSSTSTRMPTTRGRCR